MKSVMQICFFADLNLNCFFAVPVAVAVVVVKLPNMLRTQAGNIFQCDNWPISDHRMILIEQQYSRFIG